MNTAEQQHYSAKAKDGTSYTVWKDARMTDAWNVSAHSSGQVGCASYYFGGRTFEEACALANRLAGKK